MEFKQITRHWIHTHSTSQTIVFLFLFFSYKAWLDTACRRRPILKRADVLQTRYSLFSRTKLLFFFTCFSIVLVIVVRVPCKSFFIECNNNLWTANICLASWNQVSFIRVFPVQSNTELDLVNSFKQTTSFSWSRLIKLIWLHCFTSNF